MAGAREGRSRLSSIDQLPDEAQDDIVWACEQLNERRRTQADILFELNDRLALKGAGPLSSSAFNRFSVKRAMAARRVSEMRGIFAGLADQFTPERIDEGNVLLAEFIKMLVMELAQEDARNRSPKEAMELARAYLAAVQGQRLSAERRGQAIAAKRSAVLAAVDAAAGAVEEAKPGVDLAATVKRIREEVYGIFDATPGGAT